MKGIFFATIMATIVLVGACRNGGTGTDLPPTSGTATIDSRVVNFHASGFSFDQGAVVEISDSSNIIPDILLLVYMNETGAILGVFLFHLSNWCAGLAPWIARRRTSITLVKYRIQPTKIWHCLSMSQMYGRSRRVETRLLRF